MLVGIDPGIAMPGLAIVNGTHLHLLHLKTKSFYANAAFKRSIAHLNKAEQKKAKNAAKMEWLGTRLVALRDQIRTYGSVGLYHEGRKRASTEVYCEFPMAPGQHTVMSTSTLGISAGWLASLFDPRKLAWVHPGQHAKRFPRAEILARVALAFGVDEAERFASFTEDRRDAEKALGVLLYFRPDALEGVRRMQIREV